MRAAAFRFLDVDGNILEHLSEALRSNLLIVKAAVTRNPESFQHALIDDVESIVKILEEVPAIYPFLPLTLQLNSQIVQYRPDSETE